MRTIKGCRTIKQYQAIRSLEEIGCDDLLIDVAEIHIKAFGEWKEGKAVKQYMKDGLPCVEYESGQWWHYDVQSKRWY